MPSRAALSLCAAALLLALPVPGAAEPRMPGLPGAGAESLRDPGETSALPDDPAASGARAEQQRMRACAFEWRARKRAGKTEGQGWRAFSTDCMKR